MIEERTEMTEKEIKLPTTLWYLITAMFVVPICSSAIFIVLLMVEGGGNAVWVLFGSVIGGQILLFVAHRLVTNHKMRNLKCPSCNASLTTNGGIAVCDSCRTEYKITYGESTSGNEVDNEKAPVEP
jgi:hypothetical protein